MGLGRGGGEKIKNTNCLPECYWIGHTGIFEEKGVGALISLSYL